MYFSTCWKDKKFEVTLYRLFCVSLYIDHFLYFWYLVNFFNILTEVIHKNLLCFSICEFCYNIYWWFVKDAAMTLIFLEARIPCFLPLKNSIFLWLLFLSEWLGAKVLCTMFFFLLRRQSILFAIFWTKFSKVHRRRALSEYLGFLLLSIRMSALSHLLIIHIPLSIMLTGCRIIDLALFLFQIFL